MSFKYNGGLYMDMARGQSGYGRERERKEVKE